MADFAPPEAPTPDSTARTRSPEERDPPTRTDEAVAPAGTQADPTAQTRSPEPGNQPTRTGEAASGPKLPAPAVKDAPTEIGPYEILEQIGQGGMGVVYLARQRDLNRIVALKVMKYSGGEDEKRILRFLREAQAAGRLAHPGIVSIHDVGREEDIFYYSMEYVLGQSLDEYAKREQPSPRRALEIVGQVARALSYAHAEGVIHRDIKPQNIMMTPDGRPRITDFGLAKDTSRESVITQEGFSLGTPAYMSPEQAVGELEKIDGRSDVYSLGAVLYQLLTGRPPFVGETAFAVLNQLLSSTAPPVRALAPQVSADIETVCMKCLEKEIPRRYATMEVLADDIECFLEGKPILARPLSLVGKFVRASRRNWLPAACVAVVLLAVGASVLYGRWARGAEEEKAARERARFARAGQVHRETCVALGAADVAPPSAYPDALRRARAALDGVLADVPAFDDARSSRADVAVRMLDFPAAAADLDLLLEGAPEDQNALYARARMGDLVVAAGLEGSHRELLRRSDECRDRLAALPGADWPARARIRTAIRAGRGEDAVKEAEALAAAQPEGDPADLAWLRVCAHVLNGDLEMDALLARFAELLQLAPRDWIVRQLRARVLMDADREAEAAWEMQTCVQLQPNPATLCKRELAGVMKDPARRLEILKDLVARNPADADAWSGMARCLEELGRTGEADAALERAAALAPGALPLIGATYLSRRRKDGETAAAAWLDDALRRNPPAEEVARLGGAALEDLVDALTNARELQRAAAVIRSCLERFPDDARLVRLMADLEFELDHFADALPWLDRALQAFPADHSTWFRRARAHRHLRHWPEAIADMEKAVRLSPNNTHFRTQLGLRYLLQNERRKAAEQFAEVLYLTPTLELETRRQRFAAGDLGPEDGSPSVDPPPVASDPDGMFRAGLIQRILPSVIGVLIKRGMGALEQGDEQKAERSFSAACIGLPEEPVPYVCLARLHARRQSWMSAVICLERAAQLGYDKFSRLGEDAWLKSLTTFPRVRVLMERK